MCLGCVFSYSFSGSVANKIGVAENYFFKRHLAFVFISILTVIFMSNMSNGAAKTSAFILYAMSLFLLILVPFIGFRTKGARRWLYIAGLSIQPSEFIKPSLILLNAYLLDKFSKNGNYRHLFTLTLIYLITILLVFKQPDIGTLLLLAMVLSIQLFLTDFFKLKYVIYLSVIFIGSFTFIYMTSPHVSERIANFLTGLRDIEKANYQVKRSIMAYRSANWLGKGFLEGEVKNHIPDVHTDFLFPAVAEEFGFILIFLIVSIYFYLSIRTLSIARQKNNNYEFLALNGLSLLILIQACINLCVSLNLVPTKGITLPFLSYGGSSLLGTALSSGYILVFTKKEFGYKK